MSESQLIEAAILDEVNFGVLDDLTQMVNLMIDELIMQEKICGDLLTTAATMVEEMDVTRAEFMRLAGVAYDHVVELLARSPACKVCGCTDGDCVGCILKTGAPCSWVEPGLCSACVASRGSQ